MNITIKNSGIWLLRLIAAVLMLQTLYYKFSGAEESIYIFNTIGLEPAGRFGTGIMELIASILILNPRTTVFGGLLGMGLMSGAIFFHLTKLGIVVMGDSGQLFAYAVTIFISCLMLVLVFRHQLYQTVKLNPKYRI